MGVRVFVRPFARPDSGLGSCPDVCGGEVSSVFGFFAGTCGVVTADVVTEDVVIDDVVTGFEAASGAKAPGCI